MNIYLLLFLGALVGASSAYLGSFMVLKRMSLVGDALSHVALPGIAIALTLGVNPMLGAITTLIIATFGIWYLSEHTNVYPEALVGVFFTASLALGLLLTPEPELLEALFGSIDSINFYDFIFSSVGSVVIFIVTLGISKQLLLGLISEELAKSEKIDIPVINLIYLMMVGLIVALGIKFLGTLLTGALVIIPAVAAKNISGSVKDFQLSSVVFGVISTTAGIFFAKSTGFPSGPVIVLTAVVIFVVSYIFKKSR